MITVLTTDTQHTQTLGPTLTFPTYTCITPLKQLAQFRRSILGFGTYCLRLLPRTTEDLLSLPSAGSSHYLPGEIRKLARGHEGTKLRGIRGERLSAPTRTLPRKASASDSYSK